MKIIVFSPKESRDGLSKGLGCFARAIRSCSDDRQTVVHMTEISELMREWGSESIVISASLKYDLIAVILGIFKSSGWFTIPYIRGNVKRNYQSRFNISLPLIVLHRIIVKLSKIWLCLTELDSYQFGRNAKSRALVVCNVLDISQLNEERGPAAVQSNPENDVLKYEFTVIGRVERRKNPVAVIYISDYLKTQGMSFRITFIGVCADRRLQADLLSKAEERGIEIQFLGETADPWAVPFSAKSILVHTSGSEGTSRTLMEAAYLGVPCVVSDHQFNRELFCDRDKSVFWLNKDLGNLDRLLPWINERQKVGWRSPPMLAKKHYPEEAAREFLGHFEELRYFVYLNRMTWTGALYKLAYLTLIKQILRKVPSKLQDINNVLDVGCGLGFSRLIFKNVTFADINRFCLDSLSAKGYSTIRIDNDLNSYVEVEEPFHCALLDNVLEHVDDCESLISWIDARLARDGWLVVILPGNKGFLRDDTHINNFSQEDLKNLMPRYTLARELYFPFRSAYLSDNLSSYMRIFCFQK